MILHVHPATLDEVVVVLVPQLVVVAVAVSFLRKGV
jgi:hypothetical protein